ncbi:hypothetical protein EVA_04737 [gut metagenome]|uniref:Uncharacterized protein n=1 Tax=gut metagenome TaxID=749906 RepID=J9H196_9ZZZZ
MKFSISAIMSRTSGFSRRKAATGSSFPVKGLKLGS